MYGRYRGDLYQGWRLQLYEVICEVSGRLSGVKNLYNYFFKVGRLMLIPLKLLKLKSGEEFFPIQTTFQFKLQSSAIRTTEYCVP